MTSSLISQIFKISSNEEMRDVIQAVKLRQRELNSQAAFQFRVGQKVSFKGKGVTVNGLVTKVNTKTIHVKAETGSNWRVSPSLLKAA